MTVEIFHLNLDFNGTAVKISPLGIMFAVDFWQIALKVYQHSLMVLIC